MYAGVVKSSLTSWAEYNQLDVAQFAQVGQWVHWAFNFDASANNQTIWYNGVMVGQRIGTPYSVLGQVKGAWNLGFNPVELYPRYAIKNTETMYPYLVIDDLRVYQRKLADYEPMQMFKYNVYSNSANLYMHYAFDEGQGAVFHDSVGHFDVPLYPNGNAPLWRADQPNCLSTATQVVILPVTAVRLGNNMTVTLQALDQFNNPSAGFTGRAQLVINGSAAASASSYPWTGIVTFVSGASSVIISDSIPETLILSLVDLDLTGLVMSSTQPAQFYAGAWYKMAIVAAPSQQAGGSKGSIVVVACQVTILHALNTHTHTDTNAHPCRCIQCAHILCCCLALYSVCFQQDVYGNQVLSGCSGSLNLVHNSTHILPPSPITITLSSITGQGSVQLNDSLVERVNVSLKDTGSLGSTGIVVNSNVMFYSTGPPVRIVASGFTNPINSTGFINASVDAGPVGFGLSIVDSFSTVCTYVSDTVLLNCASQSGNVSGCGWTQINQGSASVSVFDKVAEPVRISFTGSTYQPPAPVNISFSPGAVVSVGWGPATWTNSTLGGPLTPGLTVLQLILAQDQYGNPTNFTGRVMWNITQNAGRAYTYYVNGGTTLQQFQINITQGVGSVRVNGSQQLNSYQALTDTWGTGLLMPKQKQLSFGAGKCIQYNVTSVYGSSNYDFPWYTTNAMYSSTVTVPAGGNYVPFNTSQSIRVKISCTDATNVTDTTVNGPQVTLVFSHNQIIIIGSQSCTLVSGVCTLYYQSFAGGFMSVQAVDYVAASRGIYSYASPTTVLFAQSVPIIWGVTGQGGTTDGNSLVTQLVTLTGQTFMCGQDFNTPPLIQLVDGVTGLVGNCTVNYFNSTYATCLLPQGQGKPEMIMTVCASNANSVSQLHLPRWPNDAYFYVFGRTNEYCTSTYTLWDLGGHTWSDNCFCTKLGRALLDTRFYQPPFPGSGYTRGALPLPAFVLPSYPSVPAEVLLTHKCTQVQEFNEPWGWPSIFMCIPQQAPFNWTLSRTGIGAGQSCVPIREGSDPYWSDGSHYMCTPANTPYPDIDGIQLYYYQAPYINTITPPNANCSGNITITLTGTSFGLASQALAAPNTVTVGGKTCIVNPLRYNHTYMECLLPFGETATNPVVLTVEGVVSTSSQPTATISQPAVLACMMPSARAIIADCLLSPCHDFVQLPTSCTIRPSSRISYPPLASLKAAIALPYSDTISASRPPLPPSLEPHAPCRLTTTPSSPASLRLVAAHSRRCTSLPAIVPISCRTTGRTYRPS